MFSINCYTSDFESVEEITRANLQQASWLLTTKKKWKTYYLSTFNLLVKSKLSTQIGSAVLRHLNPIDIKGVVKGFF